MADNGPQQGPDAAGRRRRLGARGASFVSCAVHGVWAVLLCAAVPGAIAADAPPATAAAATFSSQPVKPGLYRIDGPGGASLLRVGGAQGHVVVDANRAGSYAALMAEVRRIVRGDDARVGALVLTAAGPDQAGNLAQFAGAGAQVIVQQRAVPRLPPDAQPLRGGARGQPFTTYDTDYLLHLGDLEAEAEHVGSGRTGADTVVYFRDLRVLAVGELYSHGTPQPDCTSGGSYAGWAAAIAHLMYFDFDVAVPARGPAVGKRELLALKDKLDALAHSAGSTTACRPPR